MSDVSTIDLIGFAAAGFVLPAFCLVSIRTLRRMGIAGDGAFIAPRCCFFTPSSRSTPTGWRRAAAAPTEKAGNVNGARGWQGEA